MMEKAKNIFKGILFKVKGIIWIRKFFLFCFFIIFFPFIFLFFCLSGLINFFFRVMKKLRDIGFVFWNGNRFDHGFTRLLHSGHLNLDQARFLEGRPIWKEILLNKFYRFYIPVYIRLEFYSYPFRVLIGIIKSYLKKIYKWLKSEFELYLFHWSHFRFLKSVLSFSWYVFFCIFFVFVFLSLCVVWVKCLHGPIDWFFSNILSGAEYYHLKKMVYLVSPLIFGLWIFYSWRITTILFVSKKKSEDLTDKFRFFDLFDSYNPDDFFKKVKGEKVGNDLFFLTQSGYRKSKYEKESLLFYPVDELDKESFWKAESISLRGGLEKRRLVGSFLASGLNNVGFILPASSGGLDWFFRPDLLGAWNLKISSLEPEERREKFLELLFDKFFDREEVQSFLSIGKPIASVPFEVEVDLDVELDAENDPYFIFDVDYFLDGTEEEDDPTIYLLEPELDLIPLQGEATAAENLIGPFYNRFLYELEFFSFVKKVPNARNVVESEVEELYKDLEDRWLVKESLVRSDTVSGQRWNEGFESYEKNRFFIPYVEFSFWRSPPKKLWKNVGEATSRSTRFSKRFQQQRFDLEISYSPLVGVEQEHEMLRAAIFNYENELDIIDGIYQKIDVKDSKKTLLEMEQCFLNSEVFLDWGKVASGYETWYDEPYHLLWVTKGYEKFGQEEYFDWEELEELETGDETSGLVEGHKDVNDYSFLDYFGVMVCVYAYLGFQTMAGTTIAPVDYQKKVWGKAESWGDKKKYSGLFLNQLQKVYTWGEERAGRQLVRVGEKSKEFYEVARKNYNVYNDKLLGKAQTSETGIFYLDEFLSGIKKSLDNLFPEEKPEDELELRGKFKRRLRFSKKYIRKLRRLQSHEFTDDFELADAGGYDPEVYFFVDSYDREDLFSEMEYGNLARMTFWGVRGTESWGYEFESASKGLYNMVDFPFVITGSLFRIGAFLFSFFFGLCTLFLEWSTSLVHWIWYLFFSYWCPFLYLFLKTSFHYFFVELHFFFSLVMECKLLFFYLWNGFLRYGLFWLNDQSWYLFFSQFTWDFPRVFFFHSGLFEYWSSFNFPVFNLHDLFWQSLGALKIPTKGMVMHGDSLYHISFLLKMVSSALAFFDTVLFYLVKLFLWNLCCIGFCLDFFFFILSYIMLGLHCLVLGFLVFFLKLFFIYIYILTKILLCI